MDKVKVGVIGTGSMGSSHINGNLVLPNVEITAVCDIDPKALEKFNDRPNIKQFTDPDKFFAEADVDAVVIATPHFFHHTYAIRALDAGKHVLVEKPIAVHKNLAKQMLDAAARHPELKFSAMFNQRTIEAHKKIKELIDSGELGKIQRVNWTITNWFRSQAYYDSGDWRASWRGEGGGVLLNQCPHQLDLFQWFFGLPKKLRAFAYFGKYHNIEVEDEVNAFMEYENGTTAIFTASTAEAPGTNRLEIACDRGRLVYENGKISFTRTTTLVSEHTAKTDKRFGIPDVWNVEIPADPNGAKQHQNIFINFFDAIQKDVPLIAPAVEGIRALELGNAMLLSAWQDATVEFPIDSDAFEAKLNELIATSRYEKKVQVVSNEGFDKSF